MPRAEADVVCLVFCAAARKTQSPVTIRKQQQEDTLAKLPGLLQQALIRNLSTAVAPTDSVRRIQIGAIAVLPSIA